MLYLQKKYGLKKAIEQWCKPLGDGWLAFGFRLPWAKISPATVYYALNPKENRSRVKRTLTSHSQFSIGRSCMVTADSRHPLGKP